jgi:hypothetical protein
MIDEKLFRNVLKAIKEKPEHTRDIIDSFSDNQFKSKKKLLSYVDWIINKDLEVAIFGCWYGSILIPSLAPRVKKIIALDLDDDVVRIGKNKFFKEHENVSWSTGDVFTKELGYSNVGLVINTSCEHMRPMKEWPYWPKETYFAFQSNNMDNINDHINCVYSIEEFKSQLPDNSTVLLEDEIQDSRGTRYMLVGKVSN